MMDLLKKSDVVQLVTDKLAELNDVGRDILDRDRDILNHDGHENVKYNKIGGGIKTLRDLLSSLDGLDVVDGVSFSDREILVLKCFAMAWVAGGDFSLFGDLTFRDVFDVLDKLDIDFDPVLTCLKKINSLRGSDN